MPASLREALATQSPVDTPLYTPLDLSRYLRVPLGAILTLLGRGRMGPEWFFHHFLRPFPPLVVDELPDLPEMGERVSFRHLADLYVRTFAVQSLAERWRADPCRKDKWGAAFHEVAWRLLEGRWSHYVFFGRPAAQGGVPGLLESFTKAVPEADRDWLAKLLALCLDRIELQEGGPTRLYPFSRIPVEGCPRTIILDPRIRFGRPTVVGRGVPTDILFERHQAGESIAELAEDYNIPSAEVEEAIRYEAMPPVLLFPIPGW